MRKRRYDWLYIKYKYLTKWGAAHTYDPDVDMWYFYVGKAVKKKDVTRTVQTQANVDLSAKGNIIGIELFGWDDKES